MRCDRRGRRPEQRAHSATLRVSWPFALKRARLRNQPSWIVVYVVATTRTCTLFVPSSRLVRYTPPEIGAHRARSPPPRARASGCCAGAQHGQGLGSVGLHQHLLHRAGRGGHDVLLHPGHRQLHQLPRCAGDGLPRLTLTLGLSLSLSLTLSLTLTLSLRLTRILAPNLGLPRPVPALPRVLHGAEAGGGHEQDGGGGGRAVLPAERAGHHRLHDRPHPHASRARGAAHAVRRVQHAAWLLVARGGAPKKGAAAARGRAAASSRQGGRLQLEGREPQPRAAEHPRPVRGALRCRPPRRPGSP
eukprot:scaffold89270_cov60-Phaeocystis_antarctica.AAC.2